jgi:HSP20 family protein
MSATSIQREPKQDPAGITRAFGWEPLWEDSLFNMSPFALMRRLTEDMEKRFSKVSSESRQIAEWRPAIEVKSENGKLLLKADLPGVSVEDVKVSVADGILTVEGERKHEKESKAEGYFHSERAFGKFCRSIALPDGAKVEDASAEFANGVLEVTVPIPETPGNRQEIPVQATSNAKPGTS